MRKLWTLTLWTALLLFGALAGTAAPSWADESEPCEGREDPLCTTKETSTCTKQVLCGIVWGKGIVTCCAEREINVEYFYYRGEDDDGGALWY